MNLGLGQNLNKLGFLNGLFNKNNPFLDATVAYSLRNLGLGATHVVKVRRSSDNLEQDFTATQVTDGTLTAFCGAGDGFVTVWYDQKGSNNAIQSTSTNQPKIVNTGALILENGKPTLDFDGTDDYLLQTGSIGITGTTSRSVFSTIIPRVNSLSIYFSLSDGTTHALSQNYSLTTEWALRVSGGFEIYETSLIYVQYITSSIFNGTNVTDNKYYANGDEKLTTSSNPTTLNTNDLFLSIGNNLGDNISSPFYYNGKMQEIICYSKDKSSQRPQIETNINSHYNIY